LLWQVGVLGSHPISSKFSREVGYPLPRSSLSLYMYLYSLLVEIFNWKEFEKRI